MKKFLLMVIALISACCCFLFSGCSAEGVYRFQSMSIDKGDTVYKFVIGDKYDGMTLSEDFVTLILQEDGKAVLRINIYEEEGNGEIDEDSEVMFGEGTEGEDDDVYIKFDHTIIIAKKDGSELVGEYDGAKFVLEK